MELLVVGGGGREHAIIRKIKESPLCGTVYCAPGNGGISADADLLPGGQGHGYRGRSEAVRRRKTWTL